MTRPGDTRGSVSLTVAIMMPLMLMLLALAVEVTSWSLGSVELQRTADIAAWAGALHYAGAGDAQAATGVAIDLAELNGITGAAARSWNADTLTTTDNLASARIVQGVRDSSAQAVEVTVHRSIHKWLTTIFPDASPAVLVAASATVEISGPPGLPPCAAALDPAGAANGADITMSGSAKIVATGCVASSNAGIVLSGSSIIDVATIRAATPVATSDTAYVRGKIVIGPNASTDPFIAYQRLQNALSSLSAGGPAVVLGGSALRTIDPGAYAGIDVSGSAILTLNPGLYEISGNISLAGSSILAGSQVTIVSSGSLTVVGSTTISATGPDGASTAGGIPGILFASRSTLPSAISGSASAPHGGVFYYPNGDFALSGSFAAGTTGCTQFISRTFEMSGSASITTDCTSAPASNTPAPAAAVVFVR